MKAPFDKVAAQISQNPETARELMMHLLSKNPRKSEIVEIGGKTYRIVRATSVSPAQPK